jgi:hypothetical protein
VLDYMPEDEDLAGDDVSPVAAFLCAFLWVDFIVPSEAPDFIESPDIEESDFIDEESPDFIESLLVCVGVAVLAAGVGSAFCDASCAKAAPPMTVQPASIAKINLVLRMT